MITITAPKAPKPYRFSNDVPLGDALAIAFDLIGETAVALFKVTMRGLTETYRVSRLKDSVTYDKVANAQ